MAKNTWNNLNRPGVISTSSTDPRQIEQDIDMMVRELEPEATPLLSLANYIGTGSKPTNFKIETCQYHAFDYLDVFNSGVVGGAGEERFIRVTPAQISRPITGVTSMYYNVQDKFVVLDTGQVLEVVMTDTAAFPTGTSPYGSISDFTLSAGLVNNGVSTNRTKFGEIILRNVAPEPIIPFNSAQVHYLGRSIYESQNIEAIPAQRSWIYDCNFVEHKEKVIQITEDQKEWIKTKMTTPIWTTNEKLAMKEFKKDIENTIWYGVRGVDATNRDRLKRSMMGLIQSIRDNVSYYNPDAIDEVAFERLFSDFLFTQAFKHNPNGNKKIAFCGAKFIYKFNLAFAQYRRTSSVGTIKDGPGFDIKTYDLPGGFTVSLIRNDLFRIGTPMEYACVVIDPKEIQLRLVKDFSSKIYGLGTQRDINLMMEWKGTMAFHRTQAFAMLKPF